MNRKRLLINACAAAAIGAGISACSAAGASVGHAPGPASSTSGAQTDSRSLTTSGGAITTGPGAYILQAMPAGSVSFARAGGHLQAHVRMFGLTPGSAHDVSIDGFGGRASWLLLRFPALTADSAGQVDVTLSSANAVSKLPPGSRFIVRLGTSGTSGGSLLAGEPIALLAGEPIAETSILPVHPDSKGIFTFHAVTASVGGTILGAPIGRSTLTFNPVAQTLTVSVTAYGLTPGAHAAHIHLGSCQNQGAVKYMLADFVADARGDIINQTRVVTGVASVPGPGNWYLNLHQGGMNQILANGMPTLYFRPMLCTNITSFATTGGAAPAAPAPRTSSSMPPMPVSSPSVTPTSPVSATSPGVPTSPGPSTSPSTSISPSAPASPSPNPTGQPTHW